MKQSTHFSQKKFLCYSLPNSKEEQIMDIFDFLGLVMVFGLLGVVFYFGVGIEEKDVQRQKEITVKSVSALANEFKCTTTTPGEKPARTMVIICNDGKTMVINEKDGALQVLK